ncbi:hypothetical protein PMAYCL1PPCAC_13798, partial [Pristionchus mayeri]
MMEAAPLFEPIAASEIKQEQMTIKDEPVDTFTDINHEEPTADIFCPSTGTSRPIDQSNPIDVAPKSKQQRRKCIVCGCMCNAA